MGSAHDSFSPLCLYCSSSLFFHQTGPIGVLGTQVCYTMCTTTEPPPECPLPVTANNDLATAPVLGEECECVLVESTSE